MDNRKSWILFFVLGSLLIGTWFFFQYLFPPPPPPEKKAEPVAKKEKKDERPAKKDEEVKPKKEPTPPVPPIAQAKPSPDVTLGGQGDFYVEVVTTSLGAGVRRLTLTKFEAADWLGKRVPDEKLQLIGDDPYQPAFRLYHYPDGNDEKNPVLGMGEYHWERGEVVKKDDAEEVTYSTPYPDAPHITVIKTYRLEPRKYHLSVTLRFEDSRKPGEGDPTPIRYQFTGGQRMPIEGEWYTSTYRNAVIAVVDQGSVYSRDLETSDHISHRLGGDRVPLGGSRGESYVQYAGTMIQYFASLIIPDDDQPKGSNFKNLIAWARPTQETTELKGIVACEITKDMDEIEFREIEGKEVKKAVKYKLLDAVKKHLIDVGLANRDEAVLSWYEVPYGDNKGTRVATWIRPGHAPPQICPLFGGGGKGSSAFDDITVRVNSELFKLPPGGSVAHRYLLYHGPVKVRLLSHLSASQGDVDGAVVDRYADTLHLNTLTDYRTPGVMGRISQSIYLTDIIILVTKFMHFVLWLLSLLLGWMPSWLRYGLSIVLLTVIVRGLMFPISRRQALFSIRMQELAPELKKLQEKYKNDPQAKTQAMMELYRKHKVHPLGTCLPLFLQMPIFMGLYFALQESIQFRLAPFLWIDNLAAPDMLLWWSQSIPFISEPGSMGGVLYLGPYLNALPIIAVVLMVIQQKLMTPPPTDEQQAQQQKMMRWMSIVFGVLFYKVAAGLCIYFISSSVWGLAERKLLPKKKDTPVAVTETVNGPPVVQPQRGKRRGRREGPKVEEPPGTLQKLKNLWAEILKQAEKK